MQDQRPGRHREFGVTCSDFLISRIATVAGQGNGGQGVKEAEDQAKTMEKEVCDWPGAISRNPSPMCTCQTTLYGLGSVPEGTSRKPTTNLRLLMNKIV